VEPLRRGDVQLGMRLPFALRGVVDVAWLFVTLTPLSLLFVGFPVLAMVAPRERPPAVTTHHVRRPPGLRWPVSTRHVITSGYGMRRHPTLGERRFHNGVDIAMPVGTPVHAASSAVVLQVGEDGVSGRWVTLGHTGGLSTTYCHLSDVTVHEGQVIWAGTTVAHSGNTGRSTGPHLHWIVRMNGRSLDPVAYHQREREKPVTTDIIRPQRPQSRAADDQS